MRFGIEMSTDHTLEEVGKQFDVTRERIRQIEAKALRKLKHPSRSDKLRFHRLAVSAACPPPCPARARVGPGGFFRPPLRANRLDCKQGLSRMHHASFKTFRHQRLHSKRCQLSFLQHRPPRGITVPLPAAPGRPFSTGKLKASAPHCLPRPCCAPAARPTCVRRP